jgi:hypothetical protein
MATRLDRQIEQLEEIVEKRLDLCTATRDKTRCTLPAGHAPAQPHQFMFVDAAHAPGRDTMELTSRVMGVGFR